MMKMNLQNVENNGQDQLHHLWYLMLVTIWNYGIQ